MFGDRRDRAANVPLGSPNGGNRRQDISYVEDGDEEVRPPPGG